MRMKTDVKRVFTDLLPVFQFARTFHLIIQAKSGAKLLYLHRHQPGIFKLHIHRSKHVKKLRSSEVLVNNEQSLWLITHWDKSRNLVFQSSSICKVNVRNAICLKENDKESKLHDYDIIKFSYCTILIKLAIQPWVNSLGVTAQLKPPSRARRSSEVFQRFSKRRNWKTLTRLKPQMGVLKSVSQTWSLEQVVVRFQVAPSKHQKPTSSIGDSTCVCENFPSLLSLRNPSHSLLSLSPPCRLRSEADKANVESGGCGFNFIWVNKDISLSSHSQASSQWMCLPFSAI